MPQNDKLDARIRSIWIELIELAPQAPPLSKAVWEAPRPISHRMLSTGWRRPLGRLGIIGGPTSIAVAALLLVVLLPSVAQIPANEAAAAQLHQIADNAASQSLPPLSNGQWLYSQARVFFSAKVLQVGSTPTPEAQASIPATVSQWTNGSGGSCVSATTSTAQFAGPANMAAWKLAGLVDQPEPQPISTCSSGAGGSSAGVFSPGSSVLDVSRLPTNATVLATELETGTTGIAGLDGLTAESGHGNLAFERASILLVGPTKGASPAYTQALFNAMAKMPGVKSLGDVTSRSGSVGLGFSGDWNLGTSVIVLSPDTGVLLEARNIEDPIAFSGLGGSYLAPPPTTGIGTAGGSAEITLQWLDPIGSSSIVSTASLPTYLNQQPTVNYTGEIIATAKPGVTGSQLTSLQYQLPMKYGQFAEYTMSTRGSVFVTTWTFSGSHEQVNNYENAMRASLLFSSIVVRQ